MTQNFGLNQAEIFSTTPKLVEGDFRLRVDRIAVVPSERYRGKTYFVVEGTVLESSVPSIQPNMKRSWSVDMSYPNSPGNVKMFFACAIGVDALDEEALKNVHYSDGRPLDWDQLCSWATAGGNPLQDREVLVNVTKTLTKNNREFMVHRWEPGQDPPSWVSA